MDTLSQHEAFLRAIYDAPEDDTPRLVYADFLEEHGDADKAAYIRYECEVVSAERERAAELTAARADLIRKHKAASWPWDEKYTIRGFPEPEIQYVEGPGFSAPDALRWRAVTRQPAWFGAAALQLTPPAIRPEHVELLFALPFASHIHEWYLVGQVEAVAGGPETEDAGTFGLIDMIEKPVITTAGVEALCELRALRRVEVLDLTHNNLDNDAARALVRCPYFANLKKLDLYDGNRFRGKTWSQLIERFGEGVVG